MENGEHLKAMSRKIVVGDCFEFEGNTYALDLRDGEPPLSEIPEWWGFRTFANGNQKILFGHSGRSSLVLTLHLPIGNDPKRHGGKWFDMILSGEKTEEYRDIWGRNGTGRNISILTTTTARDAKLELRRMTNDYGNGALPIFIEHLKSHCLVSPKALHLTNGYGHHRPQLWVHTKEITIGRGKPEWGAPIGRDVFIIKLGEVFHSKNLKAIPVSQ